MKFFLPLLLFTIIVGCTVTKRVHRPGWHIEWKKSYNSQPAAKEEFAKELSPSEGENQSVDEKYSYSESNNEQIAVVLFSDEKELVEINDNLTDKEFLPSKELNQDDSAKPLKESTQVQKPRPGIGRDVIGIQALVALILGVLFLLWAYFYLLTSAELIIALFGIFVALLGYVFILYAIILGIIWLVLLLTS